MPQQIGSGCAGLHCAPLGRIRVSRTACAPSGRIKVGGALYAPSGRMCPCLESTVYLRQHWVRCEFKPRHNLVKLSLLCSFAAD